MDPFSLQLDFTGNRRLSRADESLRHICAVPRSLQVHTPFPIGLLTFPRPIIHCLPVLLRSFLNMRPATDAERTTVVVTITLRPAWGQITLSYALLPQSCRLETDTRDATMPFTDARDLYGKNP